MPRFSADDPLLKILACPLDKGPLTLLQPGEALYNPRLRRRYPIVDGIPQLLPSSGEPVTEDEHRRLLQRPGDTHPPAAPDAALQDRLDHQSHKTYQDHKDRRDHRNHEPHQGHQELEDPPS
ncbi:hypothetical protein GCM10009863_06330 [Streptomyces axinellae]|uniref:UPF0434 protein GCM10009863_06330 n=1 Tax=Streptomyces axinellae TaxID=552788 RepID=A0ABP6C052_9ACTN